MDFRGLCLLSVRTAPRFLKRLSKIRMNGPFSEDSAEVRAYLAAIVNSSDDVIVSKTLDGVITSWKNPAAAVKLFGYSSEEAVGKHISLIVPAEKMEEEYEILDKVRSGEPLDHFETVRRTRDGRLVDVSLTVSPIRDESGKVIGISKVAQMATSRTARRARTAAVAQPTTAPLMNSWPICRTSCARR